MQWTCPCRSGEPFTLCCQPYLKGDALPETAEKLMRSRFSAFCEGAADYLVQTLHPSARSGSDLADVKETIAGTEWTNLIIVKATRGGKRDSEGHVEFVATFRQKLKALMIGSGGDAPGFDQLHERSFFLREEGRWFYVDGDRLPLYQTKRNEPCWCGSGKKTKECHG